jgi:hypothetical protein
MMGDANLERKLKTLLAAIFVLFSFSAKSENVVLFKNYYLYQDKSEILADGAIEIYGSVLKATDNIKEGLAFKFSDQNKLIGVSQYPQTKDYILSLSDVMKSDGGYSPILTLDMAGIAEPVDIFAQSISGSKDWIAQLDRLSKRVEPVTVIISNKDIDTAKFGTFKNANGVLDSLEPTARLILLSYQKGEMQVTYGVFGELKPLLRKIKR